MSVYSIDEPFFLEQKKIPYTLFFPREAGIDFYGDNLFTTKEMVEKNPKVVEDFRQASFKGWRYALSHQEEIIELILKNYNTQNKSKEYFEFEAKNMVALIYPDILEIGYMNKGRWEHIISVYQELGFLDKQLNIDPFLYNAKKDFFQEYKTFLSILFGLILVLMVSWYIAFYIYLMNKKIKKSLYRQTILFENSASAGIVWKKDFTITDWNTQAEIIFGWKKSEVLGKNIFDFLIPEKEKTTTKENLATILETNKMYLFTNANFTKEHKIILCEWHNTLLPVSNRKEEQEIVSLAVDITQKEFEKNLLMKQAQYDLLTSLPNRPYFEKLLKDAIISSKKQNGLLIVGFLDLDEFKRINDDTGHDAGDFLLKTVSNRFQNNIQENGVIARMGGDEFAFFIQNQEEYITIIDKLLKSASSDFWYENIQLQVSASIGVYELMPTSHDSQSEILKKADIAMYHAKREGKNRYKIFA